MIKKDNAKRERWSPDDQPRGAAAPGPDAILAGDWLRNHQTRHVDLHAGYRALTREGMADRLFTADTHRLDESLARYPDIEHLASICMTFEHRGEVIALHESEPPPNDQRGVRQLSAELTLRKGDDPPRTIRVAADIAFIGDEAKDGFVLERGIRITAAEAADAVMEVFGADLELEAAANGEGNPGRLRDTIEEEAVRILEGDDAATLQRIRNTTRRHIRPMIPERHGIWIEIDPEDEIRAGFRCRRS